MGLRFTRRVSLFPGLRMNFSKSGASLSIGRRGAWYTVEPHGRRLTLGLPARGSSGPGRPRLSMAAIGWRSRLSSPCCWPRRGWRGHDARGARLAPLTESPRGL